MNKQTIARYKAMISRKSKTWTKSEIDSFKRLLNRRSDNNDAQIVEITNAFFDMQSRVGSLNITKDHAAQSLAYWRKLIFKSNGQTRNIKDFPLTAKQVEILRTFKKFTFEGYHEVCGNYGSTFLEIFRVHSKSGEYFDYCPVHWSMPMILKNDGYGHLYVQGKTKPTPIISADDLFKVPRLESDDIGPEFEKIETLFCDSSGFGRDDERALSQRQATAKIRALISEYKNLYGAITNAGQFQVYVTVYQKHE